MLKWKTCGSVLHLPTEKSTQPSVLPYIYGVYTSSHLQSPPSIRTLAFITLFSHAWISKLRSPHEPVRRGMTMLLTNLLNKRRVRRTLIGHPARHLSENLGQTAVFSGGWWAVVQRANQEEKKKRENVTLNQQETK